MLTLDLKAANESGWPLNRCSDDGSLHYSSDKVEELLEHFSNDMDLSGVTDSCLNPIKQSNTQAPQLRAPYSVVTDGGAFVMIRQGTSTSLNGGADALNDAEAMLVNQWAVCNYHDSCYTNGKPSVLSVLCFVLHQAIQEVRGPNYPRQWMRHNLPKQYLSAHRQELGHGCEGVHQSTPCGPRQ